MSQSKARSLPTTVSREEKQPLRFISAASLFDGHDAAINIIRRVLLSQGAEVIHLGHNRSVADIVRAAIDEDADGVAISSYQGGHNEYFRFMVDELKRQDAEHIRVIVGGGGTIAPDEVVALEKYGVEKIYTPDDGLALGLVGMIDDCMARVRAWPKPVVSDLEQLSADEPGRVAAALTALEEGHTLNSTKSAKVIPVVGLTGTGGAGKSSLTDELLLRFLRHVPDARIAILAVDPTRRRTGGALLGDRIRMNSLSDERLFMRSLATRGEHRSTSAVLGEAIECLKSAEYDLVLVETAGIGQSDSAIVDLVDVSMYVMTSDYGAESQLEKIDMLDFADIVVINKFEKRGAQDALKYVRKQVKRNRLAFDQKDEDLPVFPTIASAFNDPGVNRLFAHLVSTLGAEENAAAVWQISLPEETRELSKASIVPSDRVRYLADIAEAGRAEDKRIAQNKRAASEAYVLFKTLSILDEQNTLTAFESSGVNVGEHAPLHAKYNEALARIEQEYLEPLKAFEARVAEATADTFSYQVRDKTFEIENYVTSLSGTRIPKLALPKLSDWGDLLEFLARESLPGDFPFAAGVYPYRREQEDPTRMFAGEGTPERTNHRFHLVSSGHDATRLSTAFDSVTLYGEDPHERLDIVGRIGNSGVSIATLDDMKKLYSGFDLCAPTTSVSMTINGPAPMLLAMFFNTAIDQQVEKHLRETGKLKDAQKAITKAWKNLHPKYMRDLPEHHDRFGLALLGASGADFVDADVYQAIKKDTLNKVRGTVQADILKEDQAQNTCIFSTEFALRMMGDVQQYFVDQGVRNFYSVSISGYHIAEAGANPISQLAFTLSNGFTLVEYYLSRGMSIDEFAPNLSFFFSNGMDPEYAVIGRVARRIWARAMKHRYGASARSQMLKYHIQTSGRSLHAQEIDFNDIRTTLQALYALFDNCNSLHTNAYDEAITTPTEESVRRALAIQMIINKELGLNKNQNPWQGSFIINELTDLVEEAVYKEFERISERGGVLGAMETMYQRSKIQDESLHYESQKHDGSLPIIGVNTFLNDSSEVVTVDNALIRSTDEEKRQQVGAVNAFKAHHVASANDALEALQSMATEHQNTFEALMGCVTCCSLGQISHALYDVGGRYRRAL